LHRGEVVEVVAFEEGEAGGAAAGNLRGVAAGRERDEKGAVGAAVGEGEGADLLRGGADLGDIGGGAPARIGEQGTTGTIEE